MNRNKIRKRVHYVLLCLITLTMSMPGYVIGDFSPDDDYWENEKLWGHEQIDIDGAWDLTDQDTLTNPGSNNVIIGIINGFKNHEDLPESCLWTNPNEVEGDKNGDHYPGIGPPPGGGPPDPENYQGIDDDGDGGADFFDPDYSHKTFDSDTNYMWGGDDQCNIYWNGEIYDWIFPEEIWPHDDDIEDYYYAALDDDENGLWDDIHGWDFIENEPDFTNGMQESWEHGLECGGVAAATINNDIGVSGMAQAELLFVEGGASLRGYKYAVTMGADVMSLSHGSVDESGQELQDFIRTSLDEGVVWVGSSGDAYEYPPLDPARLDTVIGVGASCPAGDDDINNHRWDPSGYGPGLDVIAPGGVSSEFDEKIWSTADPEATPPYKNEAGTSFSTPYVAGVAALMMSTRPSLSAKEIYSIIKGTADDITPAEGPRCDLDAEYGYDEETGWGELNALNALAYANSIRNKWQAGSDVRTDTVAAGGTPEIYQPSIALDSEGYSHIVWIDTENNNKDVYYSSIDPSGVTWCPPTNLEPGDTNPSSFPDIYIDGDDQVHITWLEYNDPTYDVKYIKLDTDGTVLLELMTATSSTNEKADLNIFTDFSSNPRILYSRKDETDWDIWLVIFSNGEWDDAQPIVEDNGIDQIKPSADIGEDPNSNRNILYFAYQERDSNDPNSNWEIWFYTDRQLHPHTIQITSNEVDDINPNLCVERHKRGVYIVWTSQISEMIDEVKMAIMNGLSLESASYGSGPELGIITLNVGESSPGITKEYPKVSATEVTNPYRGEDRTCAIQVDVIWKESIGGLAGTVCISSFTVDGRCLTPDNQKLLFPCLQGIPQITGSQIRKISQYSNWLDYDGNFRLLYFYLHDGELDLLLASTREMWGPVNSLIGSADGPQKYPHMNIDELGGLHIAYEHHDDESDNNWIIYGYFPDESYGGRDPERDPWFIVSDVDHDCVRPQVIGIHRNPVQEPEAIIIFVDLDEGSEGELMFQRVESDGEFYARHQVSCTNMGGQTYEPIGHRVVYNPRKSEIGIAWYEYESSERSYDIHCGIVDVWNNNVLFETNNMVVGTDSADVCPDMDIDCIGNYHIVYQNDNKIYYNMIEYNWDEDMYNRYHSDDILISDENEISDLPSICVDLGFHRRTETLWDSPISYSGHNELGRTHRFTHITFSRYMSTNEKYILRYVKLNNQGDIVITEKDVPLIPWDPPWARTVYCSDVPIISQILVNEENQVVVVSTGKVHHGLKWRILHNEYGIFFTKLDNNGETITVETYISDDPSNIAYFPSADYYFDKDFSTLNKLEIVWMHSTMNEWEIMYRREVGYFE